jgi:hypothetical protein
VSGQDYESYCSYYESGIKEVISNYNKLYDSLIIHPKAKERIWDEYRRFNNICKDRYMSHPNRLIDRHKVTACYIYAIVKARVLVSVESLKSGDDTNLLLNENLAYTFGFSLLRSLILSLAEDLEPTINNKKYQEKIFEAFEGDFALPQCSHGNYKDNFISQLYFTWKESSYNILALADSLYLVECFNLIKNKIPENLLLG